MSDVDALRPLFDDLVGQPPLVLGRKEAVMNRVTRRLQRQATLRGLAALAVISVLGVGAVKTTHTFSNTSSDGHDQAVVTTEPPSPSAAPQIVVEPTHAASPAPTEAGTQIPPTGEPSATRAPEPTHSSVPVVEPTTAPTPETTAATGPLTVSATMSPSTVGTNTDVRAYVTARDGDGRLLAVDIAWGDGQTFHFAPTGDGTCPRTTHLDGSFVHRYAAAGSYNVYVTVTSGDCGPQEKVTAQTHVTVTAPEPTPTSTNGPAAPVAQIASRSGDNPAYTYVYAGGSDDDGWISRIVIHWGDGSESAYPYSLSGCTNAPGTDHPAKNTQTTSVPGGHQYATAGSHTVTATVTSVACDGTHAQTDTATLTVTS